MTRIIVDVPDDIAAQLATAWRDVSRGAMMAIAAAAIATGRSRASRSDEPWDCRSGRPRRSSRSARRTSRTMNGISNKNAATSINF